MNLNIREIIYETLYTLETTERKSHLLIKDVLDKYDYLDSRDKAFFKRVTEGTLLHTITLNYVVNLYSKKPIEKCKPAIRVILKMSVYQLLYMDKVPESAVINEAVKLTKKYSREEFCGFVNALLRKVSEKSSAWEETLEGLPAETRLSVKYSLPEWIVSMFKKEQEDYEDLIKALSEIRPTCVTLTEAGRRDEVLSAWERDKVSYTVSKYDENTFLVSGFTGANNLYGFSEGLLIIRDESSMLAALCSGVKPLDDITVIDVCAAPGGKTTTVAKRLDGSGRVISRDISEEKVGRIRENVERLSLKNVECQVYDATVFDESMEEQADVVICDLPCSGLGVIARKSDLRYKISNETMKELCALQRQILDVSQRYVKPGGVLIYSTCTIHKAENEKQVKYFLNNYPFKGDSIKPILPMLFERERPEDYYVALRPDKDGTDGFFVARFVKDR